MAMVRFCLLVVFCGFLNQGIAQSPYQFNWKTDGSLLAFGGVASGLGIHFRSTLPLLTPADLEVLNKNDINSFDRIATKYYSPAAHNASDVFWYGSHAFSLLFLTNKRTRQDFSKIAGMYGEVFLLNSGLTVLTKTTFRRTRPFVYNPEAPLDKKFTKTARSSFVSGHTSMTAANSFFAAKVFSDYFPDSKWKPAIWTAAAIIPGITGYLRVRAGKHYPTDTIAGYALGAAIGVLIPQLHKRKRDKISFYGGPTGMLVQVKF